MSTCEEWQVRAQKEKKAKEVNDVAAGCGCWWLMMMSLVFGDVMMVNKSGSHKLLDTDRPDEVTRTDRKKDERET
jgi:hypothetical protein